MHNNPEAIQLQHIFNELDTSKVGYLTKYQFQAYMNSQPRKIPMYIIDQLFSYFPQSKMKADAFIIYIMGYRMNLEQLSLSRFAIESSFGAHIVASPSSAPYQINHSSIKLGLKGKNNKADNEKHFINFSLGIDEENQKIKYLEFEEILGHKPAQVCCSIRFKATGAHEELVHTLHEAYQKAKGTILELDEELSKILQLFKFQFKHHNGFVYVIVQISHIFLSNFVQFLNEFIKSINPSAVISFAARIESSSFKNCLEEGFYKKVEDLEVKLDLNIDQASLTKLRQIATQKGQISESDKALALFILLLKQVNFDAKFSTPEKLLHELGVNATQPKQLLLTLKQTGVMQVLFGFVPQLAQFLQKLKEFGEGEGQISLNLKGLFVNLDFNVSIPGFFDFI